MGRRRMKPMCWGGSNRTEQEEAVEQEAKDRSSSTTPTPSMSEAEEVDEAKFLPGVGVPKPCLVGV